MAGDWIKVEKATLRKPEVLRIADAVGVHVDHAFALCVRFWMWCDEQSETGHAFVTLLSHVDAIVGATNFGQALVNVGWLMPDGECFSVPNYDRHLSDNAKKRALSSKRKKKERHANVTQMSRLKRDKCVTREEKRREDSNTPLPPVVETWNKTTGTRPIRAMNAKRTKILKSRLSDKSWDWQAALAKFPLRCYADDPNGWQPEFDWFLRPGTVLAILEGKYDWSKANGKKPSDDCEYQDLGKKYLGDPK